MTVIWITGLSGSGKSTIAKALVNNLNKSGKNCILLDGDEIREVLSMSAGQSSNINKSDRKQLALRYSKLSALLSSQGHVVVVATISLFDEIHAWNRVNIENYIEIFLDVPNEELIKRDAKGIYKGYLEGKVKNVAGFDLEVEFPRFPNYILCYDGEGPEQSTKKLIEFLRHHSHENKLGLFKIS